MAAQAKAVSAFLINMKVKRDSCFAEGFDKMQAVFHWDSAVFRGVPEKTGRGLFGDL